MQRDLPMATGRSVTGARSGRRWANWRQRPNWSGKTSSSDFLPSCYLKYSDTVVNLLNSISEEKHNSERVVRFRIAWKVAPYSMNIWLLWEGFKRKYLIPQATLPYSLCLHWLSARTCTTDLNFVGLNRKVNVKGSYNKLTLIPR